MHALYIIRRYTYIHAFMHTFLHTCMHEYIYTNKPPLHTDHGHWENILLGNCKKKLLNDPVRQCDCNIIVVSRFWTQLLVNKSFSRILFLDFTVKKFEINNIPKCTPFSGTPPQIPLGGAYDIPDPLVVRGFLQFQLRTFGACNFPNSHILVGRPTSASRSQYYSLRATLIQFQDSLPYIYMLCVICRYVKTMYMCGM